MTPLRPRHVEYATRILLSSQSSRSDSSPLAPIQSGGDRAPLFLVLGIGSDVHYFDALVRHLPATQPVYGLRGPGLHLPPGSSPSIESIAATYADVMRQVHPDGPYLLAAYSAGGIVAYELAQRLLAGGHRVALLAMIDAAVPPELPHPAARRRQWTPVRLLRFARNLGWWMAEDLGASRPADIVIRARSKARILRAWMRRHFSPSWGGLLEPDIRDRLGVPQLPENYVPWLEAFLDAIARYRAQPYPGGIVVLRARAQPLAGNVTHDQGWGLLARGPVVVRVIAGAHDNILREPRVRPLAAALTSAIDAGVSEVVSQVGSHSRTFAD